MLSADTVHLPEPFWDLVELRHIIDRLRFPDHFDYPFLVNHDDIRTKLDELHPLSIVVCSNGTNDDGLSFLKVRDTQVFTHDINLHAQRAVNIVDLREHPFVCGW